MTAVRLNEGANLAFNKPISSKESFKSPETADPLDGLIPATKEVVWVSARTSDIYEFTDKVICKDQ